MKLQNYKIWRKSDHQRHKQNTSDSKINSLYIMSTKTVMNIYKYDVTMVNTQEINDNRPNIVLDKM